MRMLHFKGNHHPKERLAIKMTDAHTNGSGRTIMQHCRPVCYYINSDSYWQMNLYYCHIAQMVHCAVPHC